MSKLFRWFVFLFAAIILAVDVYSFKALFELLLDDYEAVIAMLDIDLILLFVRVGGSVLLVLGTLMDFMKPLTKIGILLVFGGLSYAFIDALIPVLSNSVLMEALIDGIPDTILPQAVVILSTIIFLFVQKSFILRLIVAGALGYLIYRSYEGILLIVELIDFTDIDQIMTGLNILMPFIIFALGVAFALYYPKKKVKRQIARR